MMLQELRNADEFFPIGIWPQWAARSFLNKHKDRKARAYLFNFFWSNGMRPHRAVYWVMYHMTYDRSAWSSMQDLVKKTQTREGTAYLARMWPTIDLNENRVIRSV